MKITHSHSECKEMISWKFIYSLIAVLVYTCLICIFFDYGEVIQDESCYGRRNCIQFCSKEKNKSELWQSFKQSPLYDLNDGSDLNVIVTNGKPKCKSVETVSAESFRIVS